MEDSISTSELAWAAGFYDGEGCTYLANGRSFGISVAQKDRRPLERFLKAVEIGKIYTCNHKDPNKSQGWRYSAHGKNALAVMEKISPYLSEPKLEQYAEKLDKMRK